MDVEEERWMSKALWMSGGGEGDDLNIPFIGVRGRVGWTEEV